LHPRQAFWRIATSTGAMELRVEATEGVSMPPGCHVGIRVGDVLKQGRYEPQRCYHFPQVERKRNAKIDLYQHVGSCVVSVDPEAQLPQEVSVVSADPKFPQTKLKVSVQSGQSPEKRKEQRQDRSNQLKNKAKEYLSTHCIEERLAEAVKALLKSQPADPTTFLTQHLTNSTPGGPPAAVEKAVVQPAAPKENRPSEKPPLEQQSFNFWPADGGELEDEAAGEKDAEKKAAEERLRLKAQEKMLIAEKNGTLKASAPPKLSPPAPVAISQVSTKATSTPRFQEPVPLMPKNAPMLVSNVSLFGGNILGMGISPTPMFI